MGIPKQRGGGQSGPTRPGHLSNRSLSTSRGGQPSKPRKGCDLFVLALLALSTASGLQAAYVAYSLVSVVTG